MSTESPSPNNCREIESSAGAPLAMTRSALSDNPIARPHEFVATGDWISVGVRPPYNPSNHTQSGFAPSR